MKYIQIYIKEIIKGREALISTILAILILFIGDTVFGDYKIIISLAIFCISIPISGFKSRKEYYKKSELDLPDEYKEFLNEIYKKPKDQLNIRINNDDNKNNIIKELEDDGYITSRKGKFNNSTKLYEYKISLTTKGKKLIEGRLILN